MPKKPPATTSVEEKLDEIVLRLKHLDRRDRLRTIGGFFRGVIGLIPIAVLLLSVWYFYEHGDELLAKIAQQAAEQAASVTQQGAGSFMEQFEGLLGR
ncbi:hypothetical protein COU80_03225 [Candidatus Peregrinibacteria bacterium CG10_big_fil_rev_8_21_14_0_10_55_24]|nr:MAG: hypothetical protein COU80_03225 [Candidatus Peregrinibacteria bacterium CG10_big_fil_rev_8_21_14_0_10_55_24]